MKRAFRKAVQSAAVLALCASVHGQSNVYSLSIYSGGQSSAGLCSLTFPFPPYQYHVTERSWYEAPNDGTIVDFAHMNEKDGILKRLLEFQCGSNFFSIPVGSTRVKEDARPAGKMGLGDLSRLVTQCVTNRGGHVMAAAPRHAPLSWVLHSRETEDVIILQGDHFTEVQKILEQTCGAPDTSLQSSAPVGNGRSITYNPKQLGVALNLTGDSRLTVVAVFGGAKAMRFHLQ